jgi:hypothetical protein
VAFKSSTMDPREATSQRFECRFDSSTFVAATTPNMDLDDAIPGDSPPEVGTTGEPQHHQCKESVSMAVPSPGTCQRYAAAYLGKSTPCNTGHGQDDV